MDSQPDGSPTSDSAEVAATASVATGAAPASVSQSEPATAASQGRLAGVMAMVKRTDHSKFVAGLLIGGLGTFAGTSAMAHETVSAPVAAQLAQLRSDVSRLRASSAPEGEKVEGQHETKSSGRGSGAKGEEAPHWTYAEAPNWGDLADSYLECAEGKEQSPIALETGDVKRFAGETQFAYEAHSVTVMDNGHTVQVNAEGAGSIKTEGKTFRLAQFHVHLPSEHTLNGDHYPLEVHLVHKNAENELAVVGVMVEEGAPLEGFDAVLEAIGEPNVTNPVKGAFDPATLLPHQRDMFKYEGSLTTPPCTEGVAWHVMVEPISMSKAQIAALKSHMHEANNRPLQPANGRSPRVEIDLEG